LRNDQLLRIRGAPLSPSGSRWSAILYRHPYGFTGWGERQTGHEAVLRTLTCHLPTNLPPPLHSEVIYVMSSACEIGIARVQLMLAESWMADKRVGVGNPGPSLSGATAPYINGAIREQRAGSGIGLGAARNTSLYLRQPSSFACLIACPSVSQS